MNNEFELAEQELKQKKQDNRVAAIRAAIKHKARLEKEIFKINSLLAGARSGNFYDLIRVYVSETEADEHE